MKHKKFDAIKMSRDIKRKLSKEYNSDPEKFLKKLDASFEKWDEFRNSEKKKSKTHATKKERI